MTGIRACRPLANRETEVPIRVADPGNDVFGDQRVKAGAGCPASPRWRRGLCLGLAVVSCPCHLPIIAALLSGTAAGALLTDHLVLAFVLFSAVFALSIRAIARLT